MKEISLLANIIVYISLFIALFYNVTDKLNRTKIEHTLLAISMLWSLFVSFYLIRNFYKMIEEPLNVTLNTYETISNFIFFVYIVYKIKVEHCRITNNNQKNRILDFGGGGIKNPPK